MKVTYNQQTARSVYLWGFLTGTDIMVIIGAFSLNMITLEDGFITMLIFGGYPVYLSMFRVGRAPGYDSHFFKSFFTPKAYRPGRRPFLYPVTSDSGIPQ